MFSDPTAPPARPRIAPLERPSPTQALAELLNGNSRVVAGTPRYGHLRASAAYGRAEQQPFALVVGCIDARVPVEAVFDQDYGAICVIRSGGHVLDRAMIGSVEFAVINLGVPLVVVLGHQRCAAIAATEEAVRTGRRPADSRRYLIDEISPAVKEAAGRTDLLALAARGACAPDGGQAQAEYAADRGDPSRAARRRWCALRPG